MFLRMLFAYVVCFMKTCFKVLCFEVERYYSISLHIGADIGDMYG
jgi:hypothetical protein